MIRRAIKTLCLAFGLFILSNTANASCVGISCSCSVDASTLNFGVYNPLAAGNLDATGSVSVTCGALVLGANISYNVTLGAGGSGNPLSRTMSNGANTLSYNLYTNAGRTLIWGDNSGGTSTVSSAYLLNLLLSRTDAFSIYGRIPSGQNVTAGSYTDTIVATVIF